MATKISRRQFIALTGAAFLTPVLSELAWAAEPETGLGSPAAMPAQIPPGDAFARNLGPLPRDVVKMLTGHAVYTDDVRF